MKIKYQRVTRNIVTKMTVAFWLPIPVSKRPNKTTYNAKLEQNNRRKKCTVSMAEQ